MTVNLAPSGMRKGGSGLDLPIAIGVLVAIAGLPASAVQDMAFVGELGLDGSIRPVPGTVSLVDALSQREVVVPATSAPEATLVAHGRVRPASSLRQLVGVLRGVTPWEEVTPFAAQARLRPMRPLT